jgi:hypothetical protein
MSELNEKEIIDAWYRNVGFSPSRFRAVGAGGC